MISTKASSRGISRPFHAVCAHKTSCGFGSTSRPVTLPPALFIRCLRFLLAEFLESGIGTQRVPERIEPKKRRRNGRRAVNTTAPYRAFVTAGSELRSHGYSRRRSSELAPGSLRSQVRLIASLSTRLKHDCSLRCRLRPSPFPPSPHKQRQLASDKVRARARYRALQVWLIDLCRD